MSLGEKLKFVRKDKGWSQQQLAMTLKYKKVNKNSISKYESDTNTPTYGYVKRFADKLKVNANWLFFDEEPIYRDKEIENISAAGLLELLKEALKKDIVKDSHKQTTAGLFELLKEALKKEEGNEAPAPPIDLDKITLGEISKNTIENNLWLIKTFLKDERVRENIIKFAYVFD